MVAGKYGPMIKRPIGRRSYSSMKMRYEFPLKHGCTTSPVGPASLAFTAVTVAPHAMRPLLSVLMYAQTSCSFCAPATSAPSFE